VLIAALFAAAAAAPWPADTPLTYQIDVARHSNVADDDGYTPMVYAASMALRCEAAAPKGKKQVMRCRFVDDVFRFGEAARDQPLELGAFDVPDNLQVVLYWRLDGRLRRVDIQGTPSFGLDSWVRTATGAMELEQPEDWGSDAPWEHRGAPQVMVLAVQGGSGGAYELTHTVAGRDGERTEVRSSGEALLVPTVGQTGFSDSARLSLEGRGEAVFRGEERLLIERSFVLEPSEEVTTAGPLGHTVQLKLIEE
jgi:hypothetical protein